MFIHKSVDGLKNKYKKIVVGLGNFDGVHLGHQKLITEMVSFAKKIGGTSMVFTFHPHPLVVLKPCCAPPLLLTPKAKQKIIANLGVEVFLSIPFNQKLASFTPEEFIRKILYEEMRVAGVFVGYNYTFGKQGQGKPEILSKYANKYGYQAFIIEQVSLDGQPVSSTLIRNLILAGEVAEAKKFLGYIPFIEGIVVPGDRRGNILGFPTANLDIDENFLIPANGVYAVKVWVNNECVYGGVANIGVKPTFAGINSKRNIEVHVFDLCLDLYGKFIKVEFSKRLREERKFNNAIDLVEQIRQDVEQAKSLMA